jgi:hypothetical protein
MRNNPIIVQKYGGACLETPAKIRAVASGLADLHSRGHRVAEKIGRRRTQHASDERGYENGKRKSFGRQLDGSH